MIDTQEEFEISFEFDNVYSVAMQMLEKNERKMGFFLSVTKLFRSFAYRFVEIFRGMRRKYFCASQ